MESFEFECCSLEVNIFDSNTHSTQPSSCYVHFYFLVYMAMYITKKTNYGDKSSKEGELTKIKPNNKTN